MTTEGEITGLLRRLTGGDRNAVDVLLPAVYDELRRLASSHLQRERADHTLEATALVHEVYLKMVDQHDARWQNRAHFFAVAAQAMRRILVDHARGHGRAKRGGGRQKLALDDTPTLSTDRETSLVALDDALSRLAETQPDKVRIVEMRYFAGLNSEEIAEVLGITPRTVARHWQVARAWLYREISDAHA